MNHQQLVAEKIAWLHSQKNSAPELGMQRMMKALELLDNPHHRLPVIQIAGTNGKGSTTKMLTNLLISQGLKVGAFTSPFILEFNERFQINNQNVPNHQLIACINQLQVVNETMKQALEGPLIFFELYTLLMIIYFTKEAVDVALVEVGIGGRKDPTNILEAIIAVMTTIGIDHEEFLGDTIEAIAYEKFGIVKEQTQLVVGALPKEAQALIPTAKCVRLNQDFHTFNRQLQPNGTYKFSFKSRDEVIDNLNPGLIGRHQVDNAAVALETFIVWMQQIKQQTIDWTSATTQLAQTKWMVRMEKIHSQPDIYLDGAHNEQSLHALVHSINTLYEEPINLLYAGLAARDQSAHLELLSQALPNANIVATSFDFQGAWLPTTTKYSVVGDWQHYLNDYLMHERSPLVITGSLYFVGQVRSFLKEFD